MSFASLFVRLSVRSPRWSIPVVFSALWDPNRSEGIGRAIQYWSMPVLCCSQSAYRQGVDDTIAGRIAWDLAVSVTSSGRSALRESISQFSKPWRTEEQLLSLEIRRAQFDWHRWPWMPLFMATVVSLRDLPPWSSNSITYRQACVMVSVSCPAEYVYVRSRHRFV